MADKPLLKFQEAADYLGVPLQTVHYWLKRRLLATIPGTRYFARTELERFAQVRSEPKPPEARRRGPYRVNGKEVARG